MAVGLPCETDALEAKVENRSHDASLEQGGSAVRRWYDSNRVASLAWPVTLSTIVFLL
jgi:hypothetical protein